MRAPLSTTVTCLCAPFEVDRPLAMRLLLPITATCHLAAARLATTTTRTTSIWTRSTTTTASFSTCRPCHPIRFHPGLPPLRLDCHPLHHGWPVQAFSFTQEASDKSHPRPVLYMKPPTHRSQSPRVPPTALVCHWHSQRRPPHRASTPPNRSSPSTLSLTPT
jgi:hypothetical protein